MQCSRERVFGAFWHRLIAGALSVSSLIAGSTVPITSMYSNAISDRNAYKKPALPVTGPGSPGFGAAGTVFHDPTFGSTIVRMTDPSTTPQGFSFYTVSASYQNAWASDDRAFFVIAENGGTALFNFDPATFKATMQGYVQMGGAIFSFQNPHLIYGMGGADGRTISSYDYTTGIYTPILNLNEIINFQQYVGALSISYDDDCFAVPFGGIQDTHPYVLYYQRSTGIKHLLDLSNSTIDGVPTNIPLTPGVHSLQLDMSGRYLEVASPILFDWDTQTAVLQSIPFYPSGSGHIALGFGNRINQSGFVTPEVYTDSRGFTLRPTSSPGDPSTFKQLITPLPSGPYTWIEDGHWSWNNNKPYHYPVPFCGAFYSQAPYSPWETWFDEIVCVATDGTGTVWRIGHHRAIYTGNFWSEPRGNISQDGKYYIFTSNWDQTLDPTGQRLDIFLIDLTSAHKRSTAVIGGCLLGGCR